MRSLDIGNMHSMGCSLYRVIAGLCFMHSQARRSCRFLQSSYPKNPPKLCGTSGKFLPKNWLAYVCSTGSSCGVFTLLEQREAWCCFREAGVALYFFVIVWVTVAESQAVTQCFVFCVIRHVTAAKTSPQNFVVSMSPELSCWEDWFSGDFYRTWFHVTGFQ